MKLAVFSAVAGLLFVPLPLAAQPHDAALSAPALSAVARRDTMRAGVPLHRSLPSRSLCCRSLALPQSPARQSLCRRARSSALLIWRWPASTRSIRTSSRTLLPATRTCCRRAR